MTKSVGILTYHNEFNLGATLQAFALQRTIQELGHACMIIDYDMPGSGPTQHVYSFQMRQLLHPRSIYHLLARYRHHRRLRFWHDTLRRRFSRFQSCHLALTDNTYRSASELEHSCPPFDVFVAGSDQIWNPNIWRPRPSMPGCDCERVYFLDFVTSGRRVAYAPSFGVTEIPMAYRERFARLMSRFDYLSAREESGCKIIHELTGREATHVLDPSLLLTDASYKQVAIIPHQCAPCVLLYPMARSDRLNYLARQISRRLKHPLVAVLPFSHDPRNYSFADRVVSDAGPAEFLGWMDKAAFVCTSSFHGLALSLVYRKGFLMVAAGTPGANTRSASLLAKTNLLSRQVTCGSGPRSIESLLEPINYDAVADKLRPAINASIDYLKGAIM